MEVNGDVKMTEVKKDSSGKASEWAVNLTKKVVEESFDGFRLGGKNMECYITTGANGSATFILFNTKTAPKNYSGVFVITGKPTDQVKTDEVFLKLEKNSTLKIMCKKDADKIIVEATSGILYEDKEAKALDTVQDAISVMNATLLKSAVRSTVSTTRKTMFKENDALANSVIAAITGRAAGSSLLASFAGPLTALPAGAADMMVQWMLQAEMAYALGFVYGIYDGKTKDKSFEDDLVMLLVGLENVRGALNEELTKQKKETIKTAAEIGFDLLSKHPKVIKPVVDKLMAKLGEEFVKKAGQSVTKWVPIAGAVYGTFKSGWEAQKFGAEAKQYYARKATPPLNAPTGLRVEVDASKPDTLTVSWQAVSGAKKYKLYYVGKDGKEHVAIALGTTQRMMDAKPNTKYSYSVSAVDNTDREGERAVVSVVTPPAVLKAPTGLSAKAEGPSVVTVSWQAVSGAKKYNVYQHHQTGDRTVQGALLGAVTGTTYRHEKLSPNSKYIYSVSAVDDKGKEGERSAQASATTPAK
jgi:hypothetical protein